MNDRAAGIWEMHTRFFFIVDKVDLPVSWPPSRANIFGVIIASFCSERAIVEKQDEKGEDRRVTKREREREREREEKV